MQQHTLSRPDLAADSVGRDLDFIYIGTPKAGSTWLFEALREHPDARLLASKSSTYFETDSPGPLSDYRRLLARLAPGGSAGEIAHDAYIHADTAQRLRDAFPDVKILVCLREPGDFAQSMLLWWGTHTREFGDRAEQMAAHPFFRSAMNYVGALKPFFELFPRSQIKVVFFDELKGDTPTFYREICNFLGVSSGFEPAILDQVINGARAPRYKLLTHLIYRIGFTARLLGLGNLTVAVKRLRPVQALLYSDRPAPVDPEIRAAAERERVHAKAWFDELEKLIGRPVPIGWRGV